MALRVAMGTPRKIQLGVWNWRLGATGSVGQVTEGYIGLAGASWLAGLGSLTPVSGSWHASVWIS